MDQQGERCMAQSVAVAVGDIGDQVVIKIIKKSRSFKSWSWNG